MASVWFTGKPLAKAGGATDVLGTTAPGYVGKFNRSLAAQDRNQDRLQDQNEDGTPLPLHDDAPSTPAGQPSVGDTRPNPGGGTQVLTPHGWTLQGAPAQGSPSADNSDPNYATDQLALQDQQQDAAQDAGDYSPSLADSGDAPVDAMPLEQLAYRGGKILARARAYADGGDVEDDDSSDTTEQPSAIPVSVNNPAGVPMPTAPTEGRSVAATGDLGYSAGSGDLLTGLSEGIGHVLHDGLQALQSGFGLQAGAVPGDPRLRGMCKRSIRVLAQ